MGYGLKWVKDNLGITRKAVIKYEEHGLVSRDRYDNDLGYREYDDEGINTLWAIRLLQEVGFSLSQIRKMMDDDDFDFHREITRKVAELEEKRDRLNEYIGFAKTVKMTGCIPSVQEVGSTRIQDFIKYAPKEYNLENDPEMKDYLELMNALGKYGPYCSPSDMSEKLQEAFTSFYEKYKEDFHVSMDTAYHQTLAELSEMVSYKSEAAQAVVRLLYRLRPLGEKGDDSWMKHSRKYFIRHTAQPFIPGGDIYLDNERAYGAEACRYIADAIAYFGGFDSYESFMDEYVRDSHKVSRK